MIADYLISIFNPTTNLPLGILTTTSSYNMRYSMELNGVGVFSITVEDTQENRDLFLKDNIIDVRRRRSDTKLFVIEESYFVRSTQRVSSGDGHRLVVGAVSLNNLLNRRVVDPDDDSLAPLSGFSTKAGLAGDVIRAYAREQAGDLVINTDRQFTRFSVPVANALGNGVGANLRHENLLEELTKLATTGGVSFRINHDGEGQLEMIIGEIGIDQSVPQSGLTPYLVFTPLRGNIDDINYSVDATNEVTVSYTLGSGEGASRNLLKLPTGATADSVYNRIERRIEGSQDTNNYQLYLSGLKELNKAKEVISFEFKPDVTKQGSQYRIDWNFGDTVSVLWDEIQKTLQVTVIDITVEGDQEQIDVTVSDKFL